MKTINLELSEESAREMLSILARKKAEHQSQVAAIDGEIRKIKQSLGLIPPPRPTTHSVVVEPSPQPVEKPNGIIAGTIIENLEKTPYGRIRKGQSGVVISNYLKQQNGHGATLKQIASDTGTNYGTARRVLALLKTNNLANEDGGLWKWGKSEFA